MKGVSKRTDEAGAARERLRWQVAGHMAGK